MERTLKTLFDLQFFICDPTLQALIDDTERRFGEDFPEDELELLAAAGEPAAQWRLPGAEDLLP